MPVAIIALGSFLKKIRFILEMAGPMWLIIGPSCSFHYSADDNNEVLLNFGSVFFPFNVVFL